jgi:hypothetical protein
MLFPPFKISIVVELGIEAGVNPEVAAGAPRPRDTVNV